MRNVHENSLFEAAPQIFDLFILVLQHLFHVLVLCCVVKFLGKFLKINDKLECIRAGVVGEVGKISAF